MVGCQSVTNFEWGSSEHIAINFATITRTQIPRACLLYICGAIFYWWWMIIHNIECGVANGNANLCNVLVTVGLLPYHITVSHSYDSQPITSQTVSSQQNVISLMWRILCVIYIYCTNVHYELSNIFTIFLGQLCILIIFSVLCLSALTHAINSYHCSHIYSEVPLIYYCNHVYLMLYMWVM